MVTDHQPNYRVVVFGLFFLAVFVWVVRVVAEWFFPWFFLWFFPSYFSTTASPPPLDHKAILGLAGQVLGVSTFAWGLVELYARYLWRCTGFGWLRKLLAFPPDINGWWKGYYQGYKPRERRAGCPIACAFRIRQTLWSTHIIGWGDRANYSESYSVRWLSDKGHYHFKLAWLYIAKRNEAWADPGGSHLGLHEMYYLPPQCGQPPTLMGWYLNNRHWTLPNADRPLTVVGSTADITLTFVGRDPNDEVCRIIQQSAVIRAHEGGVCNGGEAR